MAQLRDRKSPQVLAAAEIQLHGITQALAHSSTK